MFLVQPGRRVCGDEELRAVGSRTGVRHTDGIRPAWFEYEHGVAMMLTQLHYIPVVFELVCELVFELAAPDGSPSSAVAQGVSGLDHELGNDTVEDDALEVSAARMTHEVLHRLRGLLGEKAEMHVSQRRVDRRAVRKG